MASVDFTAPGRPTGTYTVNAMGINTPPQLEVTSASASVTVVPAAIALTLTPDSLVVEAGGTLSVVVGTQPPLPAGTVVNVEVEFNGVAVPATLSETAGVLSGRVEFTAPSSGLLPVTAEGSVTVQGDPVVAILPATPVNVQVTELRDILLTVSSQPSVVTVGTTFTVTVGVSTETPLPEGTEEVRVMVSLQTADGDEIEMQEAVLPPEMFSDTLMFRAPVTSGTFTVTAVSSFTVDTDELRVTVIDAAASVTVAPLTVALVLSRLEPAAAVTVGETYQVTVSADPAVPADTTLEVTLTVSAGTVAQDLPVLLTEDTPSMDITLTAPLRAQEVTVMATAVQTEGALAVAVPAATTLSVTVSAQEVQLVLTEIPMAPVAAGGTFEVTVGAEPVPDGTTVTVTVSLADLPSDPVALTPDATTARVTVPVPDEPGPAVLLAAGEATTDSLLDLIVLGQTDDGDGAAAGAAVAAAGGAGGSDGKG